MTDTDQIPPLSTVDPEAVASLTGARDAAVGREADQKALQNRLIMLNAILGNPHTLCDPIATLGEKKKVEAAIEENEILLPVLRQRHATARVGHVAAVGEQHRERFRYGKALRFEASQRTDAALAEIVAAAELHRKGTALIGAAHGAGLHLGSPDWDTVARPGVLSVAAETALWKV